MDYGTNQTQTETAGKSGSNSFFLAADKFPGGMAKTLKPGEVIEFKIVSGLDDQGEVEIEYNKGDKGESQTMAEGMPEDEGKEGSWEDEARSVLSPQSEENEA